MRGWFDDDVPAARPEFSDTSAKCADGRHFQCAGWWWVTKDRIAVTCQCACHQAAAASSGGGQPRARRQAACPRWSGW